MAYTNPEGDFTVMQLMYARHAFGVNPFIPMPPGCNKPLVAGAQVQASLGDPSRYVVCVPLFSLCLSSSCVCPVLSQTAAII